jgi:hypothetical protein
MLGLGDNLVIEMAIWRFSRASRGLIWKGTDNNKMKHPLFSLVSGVAIILYIGTGAIFWGTPLYFEEEIRESLERESLNL